MGSNDERIGYVVFGVVWRHIFVLRVRWVRGDVDGDTDWSAGGGVAGGGCVCVCLGGGGALGQVFIALVLKQHPPWVAAGWLLLRGRFSGVRGGLGLGIQIDMSWRQVVSLIGTCTCNLCY